MTCNSLRRFPGHPHKVRSGARCVLKTQTLTVHRLIHRQYKRSVSEQHGKQPLESGDAIKLTQQPPQIMPSASAIPYLETQSVVLYTKIRPHIFIRGPRGRGLASLPDTHTLEPQQLKPAQTARYLLAHLVQRCSCPRAVQRRESTGMN